MTCRQFPNLTFAPRKTRVWHAATSRFIAINVTARMIIHDVGNKSKYFFKIFLTAVRFGLPTSKSPQKQDFPSRTRFRSYHNVTVVSSIIPRQLPTLFKGSLRETLVSTDYVHVFLAQTEPGANPRQHLEAKSSIKSYMTS